MFEIISGPRIGTKPIRHPSLSAIFHEVSSLSGKTESEDERSPHSGETCNAPELGGNIGHCRGGRRLRGRFSRGGRGPSWEIGHAHRALSFLGWNRHRRDGGADRNVSHEA